ncbi:MAG: Ig-like domain-containing protein [Myxococcales bacterium]|nr:Ig-like domain-containing protein [Myxococcales bacterium]
MGYSLRPEVADTDTGAPVGENRAARFFRRAAALLLVVALSACNNPGIDEGTATLELLEARPARDSDKASPTAPLSMTFNEAIARASLGLGFALRDTAGHDVAGTFTIDGRTVHFEPELPLRLDQRYEVTISEAIRGVNGATLEAAVVWSFSTASATLGVAQKLGRIESHADGFQMQVAADYQGRSWTAWLEDTQTFSGQVKTLQPQAIVVAVQGDDGKTWKRSHRVAAPKVEHGLAIWCLAFERGGDGYLVWQQRDLGGDDQLLLARFDAKAQAWGEAEALAHSTTRELSQARCAIDPAQGLDVTWLERDVQTPSNNVVTHRRYDLRAHRFSGDGAAVLRSDDKRTVLAVVALARASGETRVYYATSMLSTVFLRVAILDGDAVRDDTAVSELSPSVEALQLATDHSGATFFVWIESGSRETTLWALARSSEKEGWSSPQQIVQRAGTAALDRAHIAVASSGDAFASWHEQGGVFAASYRAETKQWQAPEQLPLIGTGAAHASAVRPAGAPLLASVEARGSEDVVSLRERPDGSASWSNPRDVSRHPVGTVSFPASNIATQPSGEVMLWWTERVRRTIDVGGVTLQYFDLDLWSVSYR